MLRGYDAWKTYDPTAWADDQCERCARGFPAHKLWIVDTGKAGHKQLCEECIAELKLEPDDDDSD